ncbi:MAG: SAP domain-containing protein [Planctomycetota bacterium]
MNYSKMSVAELRAECRARRLIGYSKMRRSKLVACLRGHDRTKASTEVWRLPMR